MQHPILMYGLSVYGLFAAAFIYLWYRLCRKNAQAPKVQTCTRQAPHVCTVNGPCNGFPAAEGLNGRMPTVL
jgi:hypothetical protein